MVKCPKFTPNIFNSSKCANCFKVKTEHGEVVEERKVTKCGYLFVAPRDWDFSDPTIKTRRWQRRFFVLYSDAELTWALDEHPTTIPQTSLDMKDSKVTSADAITEHEFSLAINTPTSTTFIKGLSNEEMKSWSMALNRFGKRKRNATLPGAIVSFNSKSLETTPTRTRFLSVKDFGSKDTTYYEDFNSLRGDPDGSLDNTDIGPLRKGWLLREDNKIWTKNWFVLKQNTLIYYLNVEESQKLGTINITPETELKELDIDNSRHYTFQILNPDIEFKLSAITNGMRNIWMKSLEVAKVTQPPSPPLKSRRWRKKDLRVFESLKPEFQESNKRNNIDNEVFTPEPKSPSSNPNVPLESYGKPHDIMELDKLQLLHDEKQVEFSDMKSKMTEELKELREEIQTLKSDLQTERLKAKEEAMKAELRSEEELIALKMENQILRSEKNQKTDELELIRQRLNDLTEKLYQSEKTVKTLKSRFGRIKNQSLKDKQVEIDLMNKVRSLELALESKDEFPYWWRCENCEEMEVKVNEREEKLKELEDHLGVLEAEFGRRMEEIRFDAGKYQREIEELRDLCSKGMDALENGKKRIIVELEEKHRREMQNLKMANEEALSEETKATLAALESMRKNHEQEVQKQLSKFKQEFLSKFNGQDLDELHKQHEQELHEIKLEILEISSKYTKKCIESCKLEEKVSYLQGQLLEAKRKNFEIESSGSGT